MKSLLHTIAALAAVAAGPASALTCADPSIVRSYEYAAEQEEIYFLLKGRIALEEGQEMPLTRPEEAKDFTGEMLLAPVYGTFTGEIFQEEGFVPYDSSIEVRIHCIAQWCGTYPDEEEALYFVSAAESNMWLFVEMPACGGTRFPVSEVETLTSYLEDKGVIGATENAPVQASPEESEEAAAETR